MKKNVQSIISVELTNVWSKQLLLLLAGYFFAASLMAQSSGPGPFTLTAPAGSSNWQWYQNGATIGGANATTHDAATTGVYWVQYDETATSCTGFTGATSVVIQQNDPNVQTLVGPTGKVSYQWTKDAGDLAGETNANYVLTPDVTAVGTYTLKYNDGTCDIEYESIAVYLLIVPEICDNGLDDDNDGFIDCSDTECAGTCVPIATCTYTDAPISFTSAGSPPAGFTDEYILTDMSNVVVEVVSTSPFAATTPGDYIIYHLNYETAEGVTGLTVGQPISNITGNCFLVSGGTVVMLCTSVVCNAGTTAPVLSSTAESNTCPATTANLSTITASNTPAGTITLEWHTAANPTDNSTLVPDATMVGAGTYHASFHDTANDCYSPSTSAMVTISDCCMAGSTAPTLDGGVATAFCDAISQDLNAYTTDTPPAGTALTWSTNSDPLITGDHLGTTTVTSAATYYGFFYDSANSCASPILTVTLTLETSPDAGTDGAIAACSIMANGTTTVDLDDQLGGTPEAGAWSITTDPSSGSASIGAGNVVDFDGLADGSYVFTYTVTATIPCTDATASVTVIVNACDGSCIAGSRGVTIPSN